LTGHGGQTPDLDGDEDDGYDEVIYPSDFRVAGFIVDDEMHRVMVKPLQAGVRLTAIFDSCHSGSALDLPYIYSTQGLLKEPDLVKEAGQGLLGVVSAYARGDISGMVSTAVGFAKKVAKGDSAHEKTIQTRTSPADVVMWSGSKDEQTSSDATIDGQATGAMSWAFIAALKKNPQQSYVQLLNSIRDELAPKYTQKPQLSCSHPLGMKLIPFPTSLHLKVPNNVKLCRYEYPLRYVIRSFILPCGLDDCNRLGGVVHLMASVLLYLTLYPLITAPLFQPTVYLLLRSNVFILASSTACQLALL
jgi:Caspase domain